MKQTEFTTNLKSIKTSGHTVYMIVNISSGRCYYGQTQSFSRRIGVHIEYLNVVHRHYNKSLQSDWDALGARSFIFAVVKTGLSKEESRALELSLIKFDVSGCYNVRCGPQKGKIKKFNPTNLKGGTHVLSTKDIEGIWALKGLKFGYEIAELYSVSSATISKVLNGCYK